MGPMAPIRWTPRLWIDHVLPCPADPGSEDSRVGRRRGGGRGGRRGWDWAVENGWMGLFLFDD